MRLNTENVAADIAQRIEARAREMRAYVRDLLGIPHGFPLPRHAVVSIA